jgi:Sec-independent protein translocase protein TatA
VFEGLFSPWHLVILAVVLFLVVGPRKMSARWHDMRDAGRRLLGDDDEQRGDDDEQRSAAPAAPAKQSLARRLGRRLRRR